MVESPKPIKLDRPALVDTGVWSWVRDRRFPSLADWFDAAVAAGNVMICDQIVLELVRAAPNPDAARRVENSLMAFELIEMSHEVFNVARRVQMGLAADGTHRQIPTPDLLIAATAEIAAVPLIHHDADYPVIASVTGLDERWFVPRGSLA